MARETNRQIPHFDTLTSLVHDDEGNGFSLGDFAANIRNRPDRTALHRHRYPELFFFQEGCGRHVNDFNDYRVEAPALIFVDAGHVHAWPDAMKLRGDMVSFDAGFVQAGAGAGQSPALFMPPAPVVISLTESEASAMGESFARIRQEWRVRAAGWLNVVRAAMQILHTDALRAWTRQQGVNGAPDNAATLLTREFLLLMERHVDAAARPAKLAARLGVSADHLSAALRKTTGRNAQEHLHARLMLEARRLLAHSRLDAAEVGWHLGFRDVSYFGRFFRRHAGMSPGQFRARCKNSPEQGPAPGGG